jgi:hypothetical protein
MSLCTVELDYLFGEFQRSTVSADLRCSTCWRLIAKPLGCKARARYRTIELQPLPLSRSGYDLAASAAIGKSRIVRDDLCDNVYRRGCLLPDDREAFLDAETETKKHRNHYGEVVVSVSPALKPVAVNGVS